MFLISLWASGHDGRPLKCYEAERKKKTFLFAFLLTAWREIPGVLPQRGVCIRNVFWFAMIMQQQSGFMFFPLSPNSHLRSLTLFGPSLWVHTSALVCGNLSVKPVSVRWEQNASSVWCGLSRSHRPHIVDPAGSVLGPGSGSLFSPAAGSDLAQSLGSTKEKREIKCLFIQER